MSCEDIVYVALRHSARPFVRDDQILLRRADRDPVNAIGILMKAIKTDLIPHEEENEEARGDARRKTGHADEGISLVPEECAECDLEVILEHGKKRS
jgi:hypothetical protein